MPRQKSAVHDHFKAAEDQRDRRILLVSCIHCGHSVAGNNAARLLKHLQGGCFPASSQHDPALDIHKRHTGAPIQDAYYRKDLPGQATLQLDLNQEASSPATFSIPSAANVFDQELPYDSSYYLFQCSVRDTKEPIVSRLLAIPPAFSFRELQRALTVAFGYQKPAGMFEITLPPATGRDRAGPRQINLFHDEGQKTKWHQWDQEIPSHLGMTSDERMMDGVWMKSFLGKFQPCTIVYINGMVLKKFRRSGICHVLRNTMKLCLNLQIPPIDVRVAERSQQWSHDVKMLGTTNLLRVDGESRIPEHAICVSGEGGAVLESSDALMWGSLKDAYRTNTPSAQQKSYRAYYEQQAPGGSGLGFDNAWRWDKEKVNRDLNKISATSIPFSRPSAPVATAAGETGMANGLGLTGDPHVSETPFVSSVREGNPALDP